MLAIRCCVLFGSSGTCALDKHLTFSPGPGQRAAPPRAQELAGWCLQRMPASRPSFVVLADAFLELAASEGAAVVVVDPEPSSPDGYLDIVASDDANC